MARAAAWRSSTASTPARSCPCARTGAATGSPPRPGSSGSTAPTACTTASATCPRARLADRAARSLAVRERLDRHAVVALAHAELVGGAPPSHSPARPSRSDAQAHVGDRAVDGVVLRARPGPRRPSRRSPCARAATLPRTRTPLPVSSEVAAIRRLAHLAACGPGPPSGVPAAAERERAAGHPRRREPAELDLARAPRRASRRLRSGRAARSSARRAGRPSCARSRRASRRRSAAARRSRSEPSKRAAGAGLSSLVRGSRRPVHPGARQMEERRLGSREAQVPLGAVDRPRGRAGAASRPPPP